MPFIFELVIKTIKEDMQMIKEESLFFLPNILERILLASKIIACFLLKIKYVSHVINEIL